MLFCEREEELAAWPMDPVKGALSEVRGSSRSSRSAGIVC